MTMYLPNHDIRPTGYEVAEFIDCSPGADDVAAGTRPADPPGRSTPLGDDGDAPIGAAAPDV